MGSRFMIVVALAARCAGQPRVFDGGTLPPKSLAPEDDDVDDHWLMPTRKPVQVSTYEQGAMKAWDAPLEDDYDSPSEVVRTQCYTGSEAYTMGKTFCDLECLESNRNRKKVNEASGRDGALLDAQGCEGPWYCSKMEVCQLYHTKNTNDQEQGFKRGCMTVRSCANHSQCFPTPDDEARMNIQWFRDWDGDVRSLGSRIRDHGFKMFYGGMTYTTTCCVNRHGFRPGIDKPCNAAPGRAAPTRWLSAALAAAVALCVLGRGL